jgi:crossover junction endodeoxyribonuclease RuvC
MAEPHAPCVLGIDPGTLKMGVAIMELSELPQQQSKALFCKTVHLKGDTLGERLAYQYAVITKLLEMYRPCAVVTEKAFVHKNVRSTLLLGQSRGVILLAAAHRGCAFEEYAPTRVKKVMTGRGHSGKLDMRRLAQLVFKLSVLPSEDAADALALCVCYSREWRVHDRISSRPSPGAR